jgi:hypothetical protein
MQGGVQIDNEGIHVEKDVEALLMRRNFGHGQRSDNERGI